MGTNRAQPVVANQDYGSSQSILNLPDSALAGSPMPKSQVDTALATKQDNMSGGNGVELDGSDVKTVLETLADEVDTVDSELRSKLGVLEGVAGLGTMASNIYSDDTDAKSLLEEAGTAIQALQVGAGAFWTAVDYHHHADEYALPIGFGDGATDVGTMVVDPTGSNISIDSMHTGDRILVIGGGAESGVFVVNADDSTQRATDADVDEDFTTNKTVNIINGGSHAGATYAYTGADNPALGVDVLAFEFKQGTNLGDGTVTEAKLESALTTKLNDKSDKYVETVSTDGTGYVTVTHGLNDADVVVQVWTTGATSEVVNAEISDPTTNAVTIGALASTSYRVVIIG